MSSFPGNQYTYASPSPPTNLPSGTQNSGYNTTVYIGANESFYFIDTVSLSGISDPGISYTSSRPVFYNNINCNISGTPTIVTTYNNIYVSGIVTVGGTPYEYSWGPYTWTVNPENGNSYVLMNPSPPNILPSGIVNVNYSTDIYIAEINSSYPLEGLPTVNNLPPGLSYNVVLSGIIYTITISGIPTTANVYSTISVTGFTKETSTGRLVPYNFNPYTITIEPVCVAQDTEILLADGTTKLIQYIQRGDLVAGDPSITKIFKVGNIIHTKHPKNSIMGMCVINPNTIEKNIPNKKLIVTHSHPIIYKNARRAAKLFNTLPGITHYLTTPINQILPDDNTYNEYTLWDMQFETIGSYVANGVTLQSRHPRSFITPLPKELYFDQSLYTEELKNDHDPLFEYPLIYEKINPDNL